MTQLTIVEQAETTTTILEQRVLATREAHGPILQAYHDVWYNAPHTWHFTQVLGVGVMKCPNDLWAYHDLMTTHRPRTVIETGTYTGGSALWLASLSDLLGLDTHIYTIDIADYRKCSHPKITFIQGDSTDPVLAEDVRKQHEMVVHEATCQLRDFYINDEGRAIYADKRCTCDAEKPKPLLVILDADHSAAHVKAELDLYAPLCRVGDWLVVEDTNISWPGPSGDRGAAGGLRDYLDEHPGEWRQDILSERWLLTMCPGGWLQRIA